MADTVNLRQRRKQTARDEREKAAAENRVRFGRPKAERTHERAESQRAHIELDHKKLTET